MRRCFFRKYYDDVKVAVYIYSILFFVAKLNQKIVMMHVDTSMIKDDKEKFHKNDSDPVSHAKKAGLNRPCNNGL
jgi:hypothetical protein